MIPEVTVIGGSGDSGGSLGDALDLTRAWISRFILVVDENDLDVIALWILHTWLCEETYTSPRLLIDSPVPGSGKTTLLEHLGRLCRRPVQMATVSSPALLARLTANEIRTLLLDEADRSLDPKRQGVGELLAILNSGYKVGATRPVNVPSKKGEWEVAEHSTFSPVAIAGNTPRLPEDTRSRCIVIRLLPDLEGVTLPSDWELIEDEAKELAEKIKEAADDHRVTVRGLRPLLPAGCVNRLRERWSPLKRIADAASCSWSDKVDELIVKDIEASKQLLENSEIQVSTNVQLVRDLHALFSWEPGFMATTILVGKLVRHNSEQWSSASYYGKQLTVQRLGRLLSGGFGVNSQRNSEGVRGYSSTQFHTIWARLAIRGTGPDKPTRPPEPPKSTEDLF